jgi:dihydroxyacetone kinase-like protein
MAKMINAPQDIVQEELEGFALAHPNLIRLVGKNLIVRKNPRQKVGLVIGHGSGHEPSMCGFVGPGLLDVDVPGDIFACATGLRIFEGIKAADSGRGVVCLISNHEGDVLNASLAVRFAKAGGIDVRPLVLYDDVATAPKGREAERRGLAGLVFQVKMGGAAAEGGADLDEVVRIIEKSRDWTRTLAVALSGPTHPVSGQKLFELGPDEMEIGSGCHGEAGTYKGKRMSADETMDYVARTILADLPFVKGDRVVSLVNGSGATSLMELHILNRRLHQILTGHGIELHDTVIGSYITTQDMGGFSLSLCKVDDELVRLWDEPALGPYFFKAGGNDNG